MLGDVFKTKLYFFLLVTLPFKGNLFHFFCPFFVHYDCSGQNVKMHRVCGINLISH